MRFGMVLAAAAALVFGAGQADAALQITVQEQPGYVLVTATGTINTQNVSYLGNTSGGGYINPSRTTFESSGQVGSYAIDPSIFTFGSGTQTLASKSSGDGFGLDESIGRLFLPVGYVSGNTLNGAIAFNGATFASLGLKPNYSYSFTVNNGSSFDRINIYVGNTPEPASWVMLISGFGAIGALLRRRSRRSYGYVGTTLQALSV